MAALKAAMENARQTAVALAVARVNNKSKETEKPKWNRMLLAVSGINPNAPIMKNDQPAEIKVKKTEKPAEIKEREPRNPPK